jgi:3-oxoacyl-[acyl-carrier protein] reductase
MTTAVNGSAAGRVAIVTGGSRGAGQATVRRLAASGYAVVVNYLHSQRAAECAVDAVLAGGGDAVAIRADVADDLDVQRLFAETIAAFGGIDVVVHAAGSRISTRATFLVSREAARHVRNGGAIVSLSSSADGADVLTRALALELRERDITVNAVMLEAHRPCDPSRVAGVIAYLLSDHGRRLTGQVLRAGDPGFAP